MGSKIVKTSQFKRYEVQVGRDNFIILARSKDEVVDVLQDMYKLDVDHWIHNVFGDTSAIGWKKISQVMPHVVKQWVSK